MDIPHIGRNVVKFRYGQQSAERDSGSSGEWQEDQYKENYSSQAWRWFATTIWAGAESDRLHFPLSLTPV